MERFKPGDAVLIIPKFAHLYAGTAAVVVRVKRDRFRDMFNEYIVEFADRSTARLFEFQIMEAAPDFETIIANCAFDSRYDETKGQTRGELSGRRVLLETPAFHIDIRIRPEEPKGPSIVGQVLERSTNSYLKSLEVRLLLEAIPLDTTISDSLGVFEFLDVPEGSLNILVLIPNHSARIFGSF
jgi:hypothetical protein